MSDTYIIKVWFLGDLPVHKEEIKGSMKDMAMRCQEILNNGITITFNEGIRIVPAHSIRNIDVVTPPVTPLAA